MDDNIVILSGHFTESELACHGENCCDHEARVSSVLLAALELFRARVSQPVNLSNVYRCPEHNKDVGGSDTSQHMHGRAADIQLLTGGWTPTQMKDEMEEVLTLLDIPGGIGLYTWGIHVDVRKYVSNKDDQSIRWDDRT